MAYLGCTSPSTPSHHQVLHSPSENGRRPIRLETWRCDTCDNAFTTQRAYRRHLSTATHLKTSGQLADPGSSHLCAGCGMTFTRQHDIKRHETTGRCRGRTSTQFTSVCRNQKAGPERTIPLSQGDIVVDPHGIFQKVPLPSSLSPKVLMHWFHCPEPGRDTLPPWVISARKYRGAPLWEYMMRDELVFSTILPSIIRKAAIITKSNLNALFHSTQLRVVRELRRSLVQPQKESLGALVLVVSILVVYALLADDCPSATAHLEGLRRLWELHIPTGIEWLISQSIITRAAMFMAIRPKLPLYVPEEWQMPLGLSPEQTHLCAHRAGQNILTLGMIADDHPSNLHRLFRMAHELAISPYLDPPPLDHLYATLYSAINSRVDCRELEQHKPSLAHQMELLALAIELSVVQTSARIHPSYLPVEMNLLSRAETLVGFSDDLVVDWDARADLQSLIWVVYTFIATSLLHSPHTQRFWIELFRSVLHRLPHSTRDSVEESLAQFPCPKWLFTRLLDPVWECVCLLNKAACPALPLLEAAKFQKYATVVPYVVLDE